MEPLLDHLDRFSEVLAVARTAHVASWDPATVRRALEWARYLRHVYRRFGRHGRIRAALERRLQRPGRPAGSAVPGAAPGLTSFQSLGRCDLLLAAGLLENRALGDGRLWARLPHGHFLKVLAAALLLPPPSPAPPQDEGLDPARPKTPAEGRLELGAWLLGQSDIMVAFCRTLPARLLASVAGRHPALAHGYLGLLTEWGRHLHYDLQRGHWVGAEPQDPSWEELCDRFQSLQQAPPPLNDEVLTTLKACKAEDGDFEVPGLSIWTDLLVALDTALGKGHVQDLSPGPRALHPLFS
ncbi:Fanconi anemia group F protein [Echinops telfairi]|uniref:Fanconi anemia group F protein n=1 Tax=Echinops telfairi TaxID=9371 RepID=A0ABM0IZU7_ECHTE|nr:Fanconi anemia group F protein [Echinops telfairi]